MNKKWPIVRACECLWCWFGVNLLFIASISCLTQSCYSTGYSLYAFLAIFEAHVYRNFGIFWIIPLSKIMNFFYIFAANLQKSGFLAYLNRKKKSLLFFNFSIPTDHFFHFSLSNFDHSCHFFNTFFSWNSVYECVPLFDSHRLTFLIFRRFLPRIYSVRRQIPKWISSTVIWVKKNLVSKYWFDPSCLFCNFENWSPFFDSFEIVVRYPWKNC